MKDQLLLESFIPLVRFIAGFSGPRCEVVLHDLRDIEHSIIAIENGYISGRKLGDGLMDYAYQKFVEDSEDVFILNQRSKPTKDHRILRLSGFRIRSQVTQELIGLMCVTEDITDFVKIRQMVNNELFIDGGTYVEPDSHSDRVALPLSDTLENAFQFAMSDPVHKDISEMSKDDKLAVIASLKAQNVFEIKGTVRFIAKKLMLSEPSIYRYLREIKNQTPQ